MPYYNRAPKRDHNFDNHPEGPQHKPLRHSETLNPDCCGPGAIHRLLHLWRASKLPENLQPCLYRDFYTPLRTEIIKVLCLIFCCVFFDQNECRPLLRPLYQTLKPKPYRSLMGTLKGTLKDPFKGKTS